MTVTDYLARCAGTRNWVCAAALNPKLSREGYTRAVPYEELRRWLRAMPADVTGEPCIQVAEPYGAAPEKQRRQRVTVEDTARTLLGAVRRAGALGLDVSCQAYFAGMHRADKRAVRWLLETGQLLPNNDGLFADMTQSWRAA